MTKIHEILNMNVPEEWLHNHAYKKGFTHGQIGINARTIHTTPDYELGYIHGQKVRKKRILKQIILKDAS